jgi:beta-galactosidase
LPARTTVFETRRARDGHAIGAVDPLVRTPVGVAPALPETVAIVMADGTASHAPVDWAPITPEQLESEKPYQVAGEVRHGHGGRGGRGGRGEWGERGASVTADVTPFAVAGVQTFTASVPVGVAPFLPGQARVTYTDGVHAAFDMSWDPVPGDAIEMPGEFPVGGVLVDTDLATSILVTVSEEYTPEQNLALDASPLASFSGSPETVPVSLNDGLTMDDSGWSNQYEKAATALLPLFNLAQPEDWVSLAWNTPQAIEALVAYFRLAPGRTFPAAISVEVWDGQSFVPAAGQSVTWAERSEQPTTITFDQVSTTEVRLVMTSAAPGTPEGFVQISEVQAIGDRPISPDPGPGDDSDRSARAGVVSCAASGGRGPVSFLAALLVGLAATLARSRRRTLSSSASTSPQ